MRWPTISFLRVDLRDLTKEVKRCADALERIAPVISEPVELKPDEAVSYVDEDKIAKAELAEELGEYERFLRAQQESAENWDGGLGVLGESHESD